MLIKINVCLLKEKKTNKFNRLHVGIRTYPHLKREKVEIFTNIEAIGLHRLGAELLYCFPTLQYITYLYYDYYYH